MKLTSENTETVVSSRRWLIVLAYGVGIPAVIALYDLVTLWPFPFRLATSSRLFFEYPMVVLVSLLACFARVRNPWWGMGTAWMGIMMSYVAFDLYAHFIRSIPRPSDLQNIGLIFDFSPLMGIGAAVASLIFSTLFWRAFLEIRRAYEWRELTVAVVTRLVVGATLLGMTVSGVMGKFADLTYDSKVWSEALTMTVNGRLASFIHFGAEQKSALRELRNMDLDSVKVAEIFDRLFPDQSAIRREVHVVMLESFFDPRDIEGVECFPSPLAEELKPFLLDGNRFARVVSPVFGGLSAQAEFELLSGVPALGLTNSVDFNELKGRVADGFLVRLREMGFNSLGTIGSSSSYFNLTQAYHALGVDRVVYLGDSEERINASDHLVFDGDLFNFNLSRLGDSSMEADELRFNYVVGIYGHFPYDRNRDRRPDVISTNGENLNVTRIANQFYYRTKALGEYLGALIERAPRGIIYVTSDHVPPIVDDSVVLEIDQMENLALLIVDGVPMDVTGLNYFEVTWLIWDFVGDQKRERNVTDQDLKDAYGSILSAQF